MTPERQAMIEDNWRRTLSGIATVVGRLAYLSSLRNPSTGVYEHAGLAGRIGREECEALLARSHVEVFRQWLDLKLARQREELEEYFSELDAGKGEILGNWLSLEPFLSWIPADSRNVERELFRIDLEAVLEKLRTEYGVASRDPD